MIYTVTLNPALDHTLQLDRLQPGRLHRARAAVLTAGGKGINVSRVLTGLSVPNTALLLAAGGTGQLLQTLLQAEGVETRPLFLPQGSTRINVKLLAGEETELNTPGPAVAAADFARLCAQVRTLQPGDWLCLCGSLPPGLPADAYCRLLEAVGKGVHTMLDTAGEALAAALPAHPGLIKPNRVELEALVGHPLPDDTSLVAAARQLQARGAGAVLVSLGGEGALLVLPDGQVLRQPAPRGRVQGTVGAGDSAVAGYVAAAAAGGTPQQALALAVAAGSATAFAPGLADRETLQQLWQKAAISR